MKPGVSTDTGRASLSLEQIVRAAGRRPARTLFKSANLANGERSNGTRARCSATETEEA